MKNEKYNKVTFGIKNNADYMAKNIMFEKDKTTYDLYVDGKFSEKIELTIPGLHNIYNSLACIAVCGIYKLNMKDVKTALYKFGGAKRRFEKKR